MSLQGKLFLVFFLLGCLTCSLGFGQRQPPSPNPQPLPPPPRNLDVTGRSLSLDSHRQEVRNQEALARWAAGQRLQAQRNRRQIYKRDAERLVDLANTLQQHVTESGAGPLSPEMAKVAARAVRVAHELRKTMAKEDVAKVKVASRPENSGAAGDADSTLAKKTSRVLNLATGLKTDMDQYLSPQNLNTISVDTMLQGKKPAPSRLFIFMTAEVEELERLTRELALSK